MLTTCVLVAQSCPALCNPMDCSLPGFSVHGIFQARILKWVAISFSGDLPNPGIKPKSPKLQTDSLPSEPPGKPCWPHSRCLIIICWFIDCYKPSLFSSENCCRVYPPSAIIFSAITNRINSSSLFWELERSRNVFKEMEENYPFFFFNFYDNGNGEGQLQLTHSWNGHHWIAWAWECS